VAQPVSFEGSRGQRIEGVLELPDDGTTASAVLAHRFPGGVDDDAARRLARALTARRVAVLLLDVGGLVDVGALGQAPDTGGREPRDPDDEAAAAEQEAGVLEVADLAAAAEFLGELVTAPGLLIGHDVGGAAALAVAPALPDVRAVATLGAPIDPPGIPGVREGLAGLGAALLVLHAPADAVVPAHDAAQIHAAAGGAASLLSLDGADHDLSRPDDAEYAGELLATWAGRHLVVRGPVEGQQHRSTDDGEADLPRGEVRVRENGRGSYQQEVRVGRHRWTADEPPGAGGDDAGPGPYDLLLASLGACTSITMRMYAQRKEWDVRAIEVVLRHDRVHGDDRDACDTQEGCVDLIRREIHVDGDLTAEDREALLAIADKCPVHRSLTREILIETVGGGGAAG
jgi:putative redox protein